MRRLALFNYAVQHALSCIPVTAGIASAARIAAAVSTRALIRSTQATCQDARAEPALMTIICRVSPSPKQVLSRHNDLSGVHDVLRVERSLNGPHRQQRRFPMFSLEVLHLALANSVLARAGSLHGQSPLHQPFQQPFGAADLVGIRYVDENRQV